MSAQASAATEPRPLTRRTGVPFLGPVLETGRWTRWIIVGLFACAVVFLGVQAVVSVFQALDHATRFSGYALDGAFQLYNPLRRLAAGEVPGRDFPFFHGVGMPWLHYPLFLLLGSNIFAAEMARWLLSPLLFALSGVVFFRSFLGTWTRAVIALAVFVAMSNTVPELNLVDPGNSMVGIRSMTVLFIAAAMMWTVRRPRVAWGFVQWHTPLIVAYLLLGVAVALGTEQGVAAIGSFLLVRFVLNVRRLRWGWRPIVQSAIDTAAAAASVLLVLTLLTAGHAVTALRYALVDIPSDQGWVFGSIPNIVLTPDSLGWELLGGLSLDLSAMVPGFVLTGVTALALLVIGRRMRAIGSQVVAASVFLWIYGLAVLAAVLGYISLTVQLAPFGRVSTAIACAAGTAIVLACIARIEARLRRAPGTRPAPLRVAARALGALVITGVGLAFLAASLPVRLDVLAAIPKREVVAAAQQAPFQSDYEVAGPGFRGAMDAILPLIPEGAEIWATYSSLFNSERDAFVPAPGGEDYIIHALGKERREAYQEAFVQERPEAVITSNPAYTIYEEWLWGRYPLFFQTLIQDYSLTQVTGSHLLWLRNDVAPDASPPAVEVPIGEDGGFQLPGNPTDRVMYYSLSVDYVASGGSVPVLNRLPRFYMKMSGAALGLYAQVLPDSEQSWNIVVPVFPGSDGVAVTPFVDGFAPFASLRFTGASYTTLEVPEANDRLIEENYCTWMKTDERCTP